MSDIMSSEGIHDELQATLNRIFKEPTQPQQPAEPVQENTETISTESKIDESPPDDKTEPEQTNLDDDFTEEPVQIQSQIETSEISCCYLGFHRNLYM